MIGYYIILALFIINTSAFIIFLRNKIRDISNFRKYLKRGQKVRFYITGEGWQVGTVHSYWDPKKVRVSLPRDNGHIDYYLIPVKNLKQPLK